MVRHLKLFFLVFLFLLLWIPLFQQLTSYFKEPILKGAFLKPAKPIFSLDSIRTQQLQKQVENYENYNFGFRGLFVKIRNSLQYGLFREFNDLDLVAGKAGCIYSYGAIERTAGRDY